MPSPYVLVGHSLGGFYMQAFARKYPCETAAIVLIDSASPLEPPGMFGSAVPLLTLLPLVGQVEAALVRIAELEKRLAAFERPPKTPDNSSLPPSKGQKADRPAGDKPPRRSRPGFGRTLEPNPNRMVDARLDSCPHCAAAFPAEQQTPQQVYDRMREAVAHAVARVRPPWRRAPHLLKPE